MKSARQTAFEILLKLHRNNAYSNIVLNSALAENNLSQRESSLASALVYGLIERQLTVDYNLGLYLSQPIKKLRPEALIALRLGAFQILFMDKIPPSAAINESVKLARENNCSFATGLINAVLHKVNASGLKLPDKANNFYKYYSVKYSCPEWLVRLWVESYGEENAVGIMENSLGGTPVVLRVNTLKITTKGLIKKLAEEGIEATECSEVEDAVTVDRLGNIEHLETYKSGLYHVQDIASQLCCKALGVENNDTVYDMCSAPGGKAFTLAEKMENTGKIFAFDIYPARLDLIQKGVKRLGFTNVFSSLNDASEFNSKLEKADKILCDVPCSGLGIIRKKPEIRYKMPQDIDKLPNLQYLILCTAARYLKKGGVLVYSTCTLNSKENADVCNRFLKEHPSFRSLRVLENVPRFEKSGNFVTLMPHINKSDGFFIAAFSEME